MALLDSTGDVGAGFGVHSIPMTYILDKNGRIIGKALGPREWESKDAIALFEYLTDSDVASSKHTRKMVSGVSVQVSGFVRGQRPDNRRQMAIVIVKNMFRLT
jgi:hypothetical protein